MSSRFHGVDFAAQQDTVTEIEAERPEPDPEYQPSDTERLLLAILADEERAPAKVLRMRGGFDAQYVSEMCARLSGDDVAWLWRVKRPDENNYGRVKEVTGFYAYNAPDDYDAFDALDAITDDE